MAVGKRQPGVLSPVDLGLPPKFAEWRPSQLDAVISAAASDTRFTMLNMPPGVGKSPAYIAVHAMLGGRTLVLTQTKGLQTQLMSDFESMGMAEIKGQSNYPCLYLYDGSSRAHPPGCDEGPCHAGVECELRESGCYYYDALRKAGRSMLVTDNYAHWMTMNRYADPISMGRFTTLILDEAHDAADALADFVRIEIDNRKVRKLLGKEYMPSPGEGGIEEWVEWAIYALPRCRGLIDSAKAGATLYHEGVQAVRDLRDLEDNLTNLVHAGDWKRTDAPDPPAWVPGTAVDWIIETDRGGVTHFQPVWASGYAEPYLFAHVPRVILVSATITRKDAPYLGIALDQLTYKSYPSPFDRSRRPVYIYPVVGVGRNMTIGEERIWIRAIDAIIDREIRYKGIIHAVSYDRARLIQSMSRHSRHMLIHDRRTTRETIRRFRDATAPCILVSPSVSTGYDFPHDACRWQIVAKIPFIDNRPAIIKARHKADRDYLSYVALRGLIQMIGRSTRAEDDWSRCYIVDANWGWFSASLSKKHMIPKWFKGALKRIRSLREVA